MVSFTFASLSLLAASAFAYPDFGGKRAVCNKDDCYRAAVASSAKPYRVSAANDCSSFLKKTVTPCPVTTTTTTTVTVTDSAVQITLTSNVPVTQVLTDVATITTIVSTDERTSTFYSSTEVDVINIILTTVTVTAVQAKRSAPTIAALPTFPSADILVARTVGVCSATTNGASSVPTYASACRGPARYSSACSCAGNTAATTTLTASTSTVTATSTSTVTPTITATISLTTTILSSTTVTEFISTTLTTTDATLVIPTTFSVTSDIVIPTTVVVSPPVCTSYKFVITSGSMAGQFVNGNSPDNSIPYGFVTNDGNAASALSVDIRSDGRVYSNGVDRWMTRAGQLYYVLHAEDVNADSYNIDAVYCSVGAGDSSYPGAVGTVSCSSGGHSIKFYSCPTTGNNLIQGTDQNSANHACSQPFSLAAIPAC